MWLMKYQKMDKKTFKPFSEFYQEAKTTKLSQTATEDILKEVADIRQKAKKE